MNRYKIVAPCLFGIEGILAEELRRFGAEDVQAENGRVVLFGDDDMIAKLNLNSRFAERFLIVLGEFIATTFSELFDATKGIPFEKYIEETDTFPVKGWSISSQLHSIPDCQSIVKKAIVERLKGKYDIAWFSETGPVHQIQFSILKDKVSIMLDTSGSTLHKRGYRANSNEAPIRETLAAAMCDQARIFHDTQLIDPFCGSGTILIEAAMIAAKIAPGLDKSFDGEYFHFINKNAWKNARAQAISAINKNIDFRAVGYDIDPQAVKLTMENAKKEGVANLVSAFIADIENFKIDLDRALVITNPPYGERLLDLRQAEKLINIMGSVFKREKGKKYFIISPHDEFEKIYGRPADKRRKLYNGTIKCQLYMYFK